MTTSPFDAVETVLLLAHALERRGVSYALGGAHAYGQYGIPRATNDVDVDVNVFVPLDGLAPVLEALRSFGITVDDLAARDAAAHDGLAVLRFGAFRVKDVVDLERLIAVSGDAMDVTVGAPLLYCCTPVDKNDEGILVPPTNQEEDLNATTAWQDGQSHILHRLRMDSGMARRVRLRPRGSFRGGLRRVPDGRAVDALLDRGRTVGLLDVDLQSNRVE